ncbi:pseudouridine synthase [Candidatus Uhrbacteria bacterium]|nr:pseudouridine synthase [Candidatus Uhrbacteria bacterium]MBD3283875.1 pseudouridine synthase [Candidatus Uhrbacteria bacterium]
MMILISRKISMPPFVYGIIACSLLFICTWIDTVSVMKETRINKYLAERGVASRREADRLIQQGNVLINGKRAELGSVVRSKDRVEVDGELLDTREQKIYIALNKPVGYITTTDVSKTDNVLSLVDLPERLYPIGRLDVATSGLLLLTNDGEFANKIMHPKYGHEKEYEVTTDRPLTAGEQAALRNGVRLKEGMTRMARVRSLGASKIQIAIKEGKNRQVRRMLSVLGHRVTKLKRVRIGSVALGSLPSGHWRLLKPKEVKSLQALNQTAKIS